MNDLEILKKLSALIDTLVPQRSSTEYLSLLPTELQNRLGTWHFGKYGWTSPVNLLITAAWYKIEHPSQDICKIWAKDNNNATIPGGFSIRSADESVTVKLVNRLDIADGFCSGNSGMQGSRAIEKARRVGRIQRGLSIDQKVTFDLVLFSEILNDINELSGTQAKNCFLFFIHKGLEIKATRKGNLAHLTNIKIRVSNTKLTSFLDFLTDIKDPEFCRLASAVGVFLLQRDKGLKLCGLDGFKTAADTQSKSPGDFWIINADGNPIFAGEVKDSSIRFSHTSLANVRRRHDNNPSLKGYFLVTAAATALSLEVIGDASWQKRIIEFANNDLLILPLTLRDVLFQVILQGVGLNSYISEMSSTIQQMKSLKKDTVKKWIEFVQDCNEASVI